METRYVVEYKTSTGWRRMYGTDGLDLRPSRTLEAAKKERSKAVRRHKPYGRDFQYRIAEVTTAYHH